MQRVNAFNGLSPQRINSQSINVSIQNLLKKDEDYLQETDTISRMVYGMACAYMLTGKDLYLDAAEQGTKYLRDKMKFTDTDTGASENREWNCLHDQCLQTLPQKQGH